MKTKSAHVFEQHFSVTSRPKYPERTAFYVAYDFCGDRVS